METTTHFQFPNGDLVTVSATEGAVVARPDGALSLSGAEFTALSAQAEARHAAHVAELTAGDTARGLKTYGALVSSGLPADVARALSGYTPPTGQH
ncbi:hypothetical protein ABT300_08860 [Streptomyces sp. NPDC001027]|uniref:hypothetical protein n=1 Tax=Streptomyces sp. NPDC001027 TaxID=3154771 RepID=UPI00331957B7